MANILVTGGAGYVGSHCCLAVAEAGHTPIAFDNLHNGHSKFVKWGPLVVADIRDDRALDQVFRDYRPEAVLHCAALLDIADSAADPAAFYNVNVSGSLTLLSAMLRHQVRTFVFSSSCATYGASSHLPISESHLQAPVSPYGHTKVIIERAVHEFGAAYGLRFALLRYFNAAGASDAGLGQRQTRTKQVIPQALAVASGQSGSFKIFGADYDTPDGTCIRDYVHVLDLADAHVRAINHLLQNRNSFVINLGTGEGSSVLQVIAEAQGVSKRTLRVEIAPRRSGDPPVLVADNVLAHRLLGWRPQHNLTQIVSSAWRWHSEIEPTFFS